MRARSLFLFALLLALPAWGDTNISGNIGVDTTWTVAGSPYILTGDVTVGSSSGATLTIDPGVVVKGNTNAHFLINYSNKGALVVNGTAANPVLFTANNSTSQGAWFGLRFGSVAGAPASSVTYLTVEYAGSNLYALGGITIVGNAPALDNVIARNNQYAGIKIEGGSATITSTTVRDNGGRGIYMFGGSATLTDVTLLLNSSTALSAHAMGQLNGMTGISATGNGADVIELRGGDITANRTWKTCAVPYLVAASIHVKASSSPILTIEPGNTIKFAANSQIAVNWQDKGGLVANGTSSAPILFTSSSASPTPGIWWGLYFGETAGGPASTLSYATIEYGGYPAVQRGGVTIHNVTPSFSNVTIRNSAYAGAAMHGAGASFVDSTITGSAGPGIYAINPVTLTLTNTAFTNNAGYAVSAPPASTFSDTTGISASGNTPAGRDVIEVRGGDITTSRTWPASPIPYVVSASIHVRGNSSPILTIAAGNTIKFAVNSQIAVNYQNKGGLVANGTSSAPILFTSNAASPTPGSWYGLYFGEWAGAPASSVSHATIEYGGLAAAERGGVTIHNVTPTFSNVTIRNSAYAGVALHGAGLTLDDSTITANSGPGIRGLNPVTLTLTDSTFTNNAGYAITVHPMTTLAGLTGLTASGNGAGRDAIEMRSGVISSNRTWPLSPLPYVISGSADVYGASAPTLTIAAGNTIRFNAGAQLLCNHNGRGAIQAHGTAAAPILFTSNGTQTAGYWIGLWFGPVASPPPSSVTYAIIEYGGNPVRGGITVQAGSPVFDHLVLRENTYAGFVSYNTSSARITNTHFYNNPAGVRTHDQSTVIAKLNYWNNAAGPCITGCASGQQSVTSAVKYEPWLTSTPTEPQFVVDSTQKNRIFSPVIGAVTTVDFSTALSGDAAITIRNASSTTVRTFNTSGLTGQFVWDGKNDAGVVQPDGTYSYEIASTAASQPPAAIARGLAVIDSTRALTLTNPTASEAFFSPNADSVKDSVTVSATTNYDDATWTVSILDSSSTVVRTQNGSGLAVSYAWDGKNGSGVVQPDGLYTLRVDVAEGTASVQKSTSSTLDVTLPALNIATPIVNAVLSNVYTNGETLVVPTGSVTDTNLNNWTFDLGSGASPSSWGLIGYGYAPVTNGNLAGWQTANSANGTYSMRLLAWDKAGNFAIVHRSPLTLGNFKATISTYQFNVANNQTVTYTSTIPFQLTETVVVKNEAGAVVRNLVPGVARAAGTYPDVFNGRNDASVLLPDGPYFYVATVTDGTYTLVWDLSNDFRNDYNSWNDNLNVQPYDPFNNKPLTFNYNFSQPGRVTIATSTNPGSVIGFCNAPTATFYCPVIDRWEPSGARSFTWSGIDHTGAYRTIRSVAIGIGTNKWPKNAALLYGAQAKVTNVKVTPPVYGPAVGTQTIEFDLTTYNNQPANITIDLVNLSTNSTLRTLTLSNQAVGHVTTTWNGRADNDMWVAPGYYAVKVTATDAQGNVARGEILTNIQY